MGTISIMQAKCSDDVGFINSIVSISYTHFYTAAPIKNSLCTLIGLIINAFGELRKKDNMVKEELKVLGGCVREGRSGEEAVQSGRQKD